MRGASSVSSGCFLAAALNILTPASIGSREGAIERKLDLIGWVEFVARE